MLDAAAVVIRERSGHAFDPAVVEQHCVDDPAGVLSTDDDGSVWDADAGARAACPG